MKMFDQKNNMNSEDNKNWLSFLIIAAIIYFSYDHFILKPKMEAVRAAQMAAESSLSSEQLAVIEGAAAEKELTRDAALAKSQRLKIDNAALKGSVVLKGARIDDISLKNYFVELDKVKNVVLFSPSGTAHARYAEFGWVSADKTMKVPGPDTLWRLRDGGNDDKITKEQNAVLFWDNGAGVRFEIELDIDDNYLLKVTQRVINNSGKDIKLSAYSLLSQKSVPESFEGRFVVHEGPIGYIGDELIEISYKKMAAKPAQSFHATNGWIGISDKYWFSSLMPEQGEMTKYRFVYVEPENEKAKPRYQVDVLRDVRNIAAGESVEETMNMFVGAKEMALLEKYEEDLGLKHFDLAVDFGLYYFLTRPFFYILHFLASVTGSFGIAILCLTVIIRAAVFPLAQTSFRSFARLKEIAPQMKELREQHEDDKQKLQEALVKLYEKEKVNPMAGCFPILLQIPIFFALYKVLSVSIEMRHTPFYGWVKDLSAPDPTSFLNLFGLLPYDAPEFLHIGAWPCLMLFFMLLQKSLHPPAQDKMQSIMMWIFPLYITYFLSNFAVGLVIYWTLSNALSVLQQYVLMRSMGQEIHFFKRSKADKEMEELVQEGPSVHPELGVIEDQVEEALFGKEQEGAEEKTAGQKEQKPVSPPKPKKKKKKK